MALLKKITKVPSLAEFRVELLCFHRLSSLFALRGICDVSCAPVSEMPLDGFSPSPSNQYYRMSEVFRDSRDWAPKECCDVADNLVQNLVCAGDEVSAMLDEKVRPLLFGDFKRAAFIKLMGRLVSRPGLALEVLKWRRNLADFGVPMIREEYSKCIAVAGRLKNVALAVELFEEANCRDWPITSVYNALLGAYMYNVQSDKCQVLYKYMKNKPGSQSIVTCNILLSVYGRTVLVDQMEETIREIVDLKLSPNRSTFKMLISGYLSAWMWDSMENVFRIMQASFIRPDREIYLLMLRGYALSNNLEQMESTYELVKDHVNSNEYPLIRCMVCAYGRSSVPDKVEKLESMLRLIPVEDYRPWLNVLLIRFYANEYMLEKMEKFIDDAFDHNTIVTSIHVIKAISAAYFHLMAIENLNSFIRRAEHAGWRLCKSLYHCKMIMYGVENRILEMEAVLKEMAMANFHIGKRTLIILHQSYLAMGQSNKAKLVAGFLCKSGYGLPESCPT